jgi:hypothetical protein
MEIAALTAFLAPYLARLLKPAQEGLADAAEQLGDKAWEFAKQLWGRLRGRVEEKPAAMDVAKDVAAQPDSEDARQALAYQLKKLLTEDPALADEIKKLWDEAARDPQLRVQVTASGERSIAVGHDATGTFTTGDTNAS